MTYSNIIDLYPNGPKRRLQNLDAMDEFEVSSIVEYCDAVFQMGIAVGYLNIEAKLLALLEHEHLDMVRVGIRKLADWVTLATFLL